MNFGTVTCPKCGKKTEPKVSVNPVLIVECSKCGYNMAKEVMEAREENN